LIVSLFLGFFVMIVELPSRHPGGSSNGGSPGRVTRNCPDRRSRRCAYGTATQSPLFGIRHAGATTQRQADNQKKYD
jgi:hypothetical protein